MKTRAEIRAAFWQAFPQFRRQVKPAGRSPKTGRILYVEKRQNDYPATVRTAFVDFLDGLARSGQVSDSLADRATL